MSNMFAYDYALTGLDLSSFVTNHGTNGANISAMFMYCTHMEWLNLTQFTSTNEMSSMCSQLASALTGTNTCAIRCSSAFQSALTNSDNDTGIDIDKITWDLTDDK